MSIEVLAAVFYSLVMFWLFLCAVIRVIDEEREIRHARGMPSKGEKNLEGSGPAEPKNCGGEIDGQSERWVG